MREKLDTEIFSRRHWFKVLVIMDENRIFVSLFWPEVEMRNKTLKLYIFIWRILVTKEKRFNYF